jgi:REP element-mobilizing transposase RayT
MNRTAGAKDSYPLDDVDREYGMNLVRRLSKYYLLEFISMCWMGNHFHIVLYAPSESELPQNSEIAARHNAFYGENSPKAIDPTDFDACLTVGERMIDISRFMKDFQQRYVFYFNKTHQRRGHFWADRFKSTILEGRQALWSAVKYVELNPVRAGLVEDPADYRHCAWGWMAGSGKHPFGDSFVRHMRRSLGDVAVDMTPDALFARFNGELARTIAC